MFCVIWNPNDRACSTSGTSCSCKISRNRVCLSLYGQYDFELSFVFCQCQDSNWSQTDPKPGPNRTDSVGIWPDLARIQPESGWIQLDSVRIRPDPARIPPDSAGIRPDPARIQRESGRILPESEQCAECGSAASFNSNLYKCCRCLSYGLVFSCFFPCLFSGSHSNVSG